MAYTGKKPYRILMTTADKYIHSIKPMAFLMKKYWPNHPDVVVGGFSEPGFDMPDGFSFYSIGQMEDYPMERWSDALMKFLRDVPDEVFIYMLDDMWPIRRVYDEAVDMCYDYMKQFEYVARLDLTGDRLHAGDASFYGMLGHIKLIFSNPDGQYHLSTMPAFWRKKHLMKALVPNETPWQVELQGTPRLGRLKDSVIVLGTDVWPIRNTLAFRGGNPGHLLLDEIDPADIDEMKKENLI